MGLGKLQNGKYQPITPYKGSWAHQMQQIREGTLKFTPPPQPQDFWVTLPGIYDAQGNKIKDS